MLCIVEKYDKHLAFFYILLYRVMLKVELLIFLLLFTVAFDGPTFPEINRIVEKYGYYDTQYSDKKVIYEELNCRVKHKVNEKYKFKLELDENE